ncbi:MAG: sulfite exporter TauE/SafE family protein [Chthoniobacteraceae bacterium]
MDFFHFTPAQWMLAAVAAFMVGLAKSGFNGVGMLVLVFMACAMQGYERESTGVVLPMLVCGDLLAFRTFRSHIQWGKLRQMLLPAAIGIALGYLWMNRVSNASFKPLIGGIVLLLLALHLLRQAFPGPFQAVPRRPWFVWGMGIAAGVTTMMANAAGPIVTLFFLALELPKLEFVATGGLFFLIVNLFKLPFSYHLGLIGGPSLAFNAALLPLVLVGFFGGRQLLHRMRQEVFEKVLLVLTGVSALHLIFR